MANSLVIWLMYMLIKLCLEIRLWQHIYKEGATKLFVISLPPFGCMPSQITMHNLIGDTCVEEYNNVAISFNKKLESLLHSVQPTLPDLKITYVDIYYKPLDILQHPRNYGNFMFLTLYFQIQISMTKIMRLIR